MSTAPKNFWPPSPPAGDYFRVGMAHTTFVDRQVQARDHFARYHAIHIAKIFESDLLATIQRFSVDGSFGPGQRHSEDNQPVPGFREVELTPQRTGRLINLALNRPELRQWLEDVSGVPPLTSIEGRMVQTLLRAGDELIWHDDRVDAEGRQLAVVIDLSLNPYTGGEFQLRSKQDQRFFQHHYEHFASALIFRVTADLEHCVLPLLSGGPRRVFAGWASTGKVQ